MNPVAVLIAGATVLVSGHRAAAKSVDGLEETLFRMVNSLSDSINGPVWLMMQTGSLGAAWVAAGVGWASGRRGLAVRLASAGSASWLVCKLGKRWIDRDRPTAYLPDVRVRGRRQKGGGYPSGHAAVAMSLALVAAGGSGFTRNALVAMATGTGLARVYVGAHLPYDVVGGWAIGVLSARAALALPD